MLFRSLQKAAEIALTDFRTGAWGRITLETPEQFAQWLAAGRVLDAKRQAKREARSQKPVPQRDAAKLLEGDEPAA